MLENSLIIEEISSVSGSSIIASLLCSGKNPQEVLQILKSVNFKKLVKFNILKGSLFRFENAKTILESILQFNSFENLKIKLYISVCNFETMEIEYISNGSLFDSILASCSLYPLFPIYSYNQQFYIDGGFMNNLPIEPLKLSNPIIALNVNPKYPLKIKRLKFSNNLRRILYMMFYANINSRVKLADFYFENLEIGGYSILDTKNFDYFFYLGYKFAKENSAKNDFITKIKDLNKVGI